MLIYDLFFELIRVAIGTQSGFSRLPNTDDWDELYAIARKQSLLGIAFIGLQKLVTDLSSQHALSKRSLEHTQCGDDLYTRIGIGEDTYFTWAGVAAKINIQNEILNQLCAELVRKFAADGFNSCILKGQGVAQQYITTNSAQDHYDLRVFRQSGDIDVWVLGDYSNTIKYLKGLGVLSKVTANHAKANLFEETEVEVHPIPAIFRCPWTNRKWKQFCKAHQEDWQLVNVNLHSSSSDQAACSPCSLMVPSAEFNLIFLMVHMYQHSMREGIGLRQMMDYYFVLSTSKVSSSKLKEVSSTIEKLGMKRYACGVMYIMHNVFGMAGDRLICEVDPEAGVKLLSEVMTGGNFGHHDKRNGVAFDSSSSPLQRVWNSQKRNMRFLEFGFWEIACSPVWRLWHFFWSKINGYR